MGGLLACTAEVAVRILVSGAWAGVEWLDGMLTALAVYVVAGAVLGAGFGSMPGARSRLAGECGDAPRAAAVAFGGVSVLVVALEVSAFVAPGGGLFGVWVGLGVATFGIPLVWVVRTSLERLVAPLVTTRGPAWMLGLCVGVLVACYLPAFVLHESLANAGQAWARAGAVFLALILAAASGAGLWLAPIREPIDARRLWGWTLGSCAVAVAGSLALAAMTGPRQGDASSPNLLLIVVDTLRRDHLTPYGYERDTSPRLSTLAARGVLFEDAVSTASFTMPSMASLLTSRLPYQHGVRHHPSPLADSESTLAEVLSERGYATGAFVSNPLLSRRWGFSQGFDSFDVVKESPWGPAHRLRLVQTLDRMRRRRPRADQTIEAAIRWIETRREGPFFLWVHLIDPHFPYNPPAPHDERFLAGPADEYEALVGAIHRKERMLDDVATDAALPREVLEQARALYDGEISFTDEQVGLLVDALEELGMSERTLIVFTSDHGEGFGEHGVAFEHSFNTHEELMRVPLLLAWQGRLPEGVRISSQVSLLDLAPTLLDLLDVDAPESMRGRSLLPLLSGAAPAGESEPAYAEAAPLLPGHPTYEGMSKYPAIYRTGMAGKWRMMRRYPWKLIHVPGRPEGENLLFHLELDPHELEDRASRDPEIAAALMSHLRDVLEADEASGADPSAVSPDELEKLRALGYAR